MNLRLPFLERQVFELHITVWWVMRSCERKRAIWVSGVQRGKETEGFRSVMTKCIRKTYFSVE
jgi:hypothetical protein